VSRRFAFLGRVSTEDNQDPEASRNWQLDRAHALVDPVGEIVAQYFDIGQSRSVPWKRRPQASALLAALRDPDRGFDGIVIGEPHRAFYGNQYGLTFPVLQHYGVELWVPEVGGAIDPDSEAHDLIMSVFGGMSKGERTRIKIRTRAAMASQAEVEGRFLGGRPPYGYRLKDCGPHPNPAKSAEGKRARQLEPHPDTALIVRRIFDEYVAGKGYFAIAEGLTRDGIPSPSGHDPERNTHRDGKAWAKSAVRAILTNPRYTGRQVWGKQRKDEVLIDVEDVGLGHAVKMRWNEPGSWTWSAEPAHEPLIDTTTFERAQLVMATNTRSKPHPHTRVERPYALRGRFICGACDRRMQAQWNHERAHHRCRYPNEYALAGKIAHPLNVYVAERDVLPVLDDWLMRAFAPHHLAETIEKMRAAQGSGESSDPIAQAAKTVIADCDRKLNQYKAALDAGADPVLVAGWMKDAQARKAAAAAQISSKSRQDVLTADDISALLNAVGGMRKILAQGDPTLKAPIYERLGLSLTYEPDLRLVRAKSEIRSASWAYGTCPEGDLNPHAR
jgi:site-specific DNA recombinase